MGNKAVESSMHKSLNATKSIYPNIPHKEEKDLKNRKAQFHHENNFRLREYCAFVLPVKILRNFGRHVIALYKDQLCNWTKKPNFDHNSGDVITQEY